MPETFLLDAPGIAKLAAQLAAILRQDGSLRTLQGQNAPQAKAFDQPAAIAVGTVYNIAEAQPSNVAFYQLVITFESTCGSGRYRIDGPPPSLTTGVQIPSGGVVLTITGSDNIRNFKMTPEAGQTLVFSRYLFL